MVTFIDFLSPFRYTLTVGNNCVYEGRKHMLQTKDLTKIYKPKKGVPVTALDKVTLTFPDTGMVFLLGKSGSGKSTLLNVLGGLDSYNNGDIIIKGVSTKKFKQRDFDSYRNTYVGFIFQEYNVLDEFTVGANIALAIELQNRKASDEEVNEILKEVDLDGYGNRKPNELSGGQKQRVAIARALVKQPEIIMADEPTGALDSNTGKQVLGTLKKLSKNKLVIVVSHDREFAEQYGDRIIELSDGKVIRDVVPDESASGEAFNAPAYFGNTIALPQGYHITEQDRIAINEYIEKLHSGAVLTVSTNSSGRRFVETDVSEIASDNAEEFRPIKSKLPLKSAFKIGGSGLKHKKIRLTITILLSCVAFALFGLADTFGSYNHPQVMTNSLADSGISYLSVAKSKKLSSGSSTWWDSYGYRLSEEDLAEATAGTGVTLSGVFVPIASDLTFENYINTSAKLTESDYSIYTTGLSGFTEISEELLNNAGFTLLAGALPDGNKNEIAVSEYVLETFKKAGYFDGVSYTVNSDGTQTPNYQTINTAEDLVGKILNLDGTDYIITAVIDTGFDLSRYTSLTEENENQTTAEQLVDYALMQEFSCAISYSYIATAMMGEGGVARLIAAEPPMTEITEGYLNFYNDDCGIETSYLTRLSDIPNERIVWLGEEKQSLGEHEVIVTLDAVYMYAESEEDDVTEFLAKHTTLEAWEMLYGSDDESNTTYTIVGYIDNTSDDTTSQLSLTVVCSDAVFEKFTDGGDGVYDFAVGAMPQERDAIRAAVDYCYREDTDVRYEIQNAVSFELDAVNEALQILSGAFLWIGLGFALFAALMLANFIGTSIAYKKQEIGILRAIGSRSNDVFRIFFAESFIIAMINFVLSSAAVFGVVTFVNYLVRTEVGLLITVLNFGVRQLALLLVVSVLVAWIASFLPVKRIASKRPIDAIRNR